MIEGIVNILNASLQTTGRIDKRYCITEKRDRTEGDTTTNVPYEINPNGEVEAVNTDNPSLSWWRITGQPSFEEVVSSYSKNKLQATYPLRLVVMFRREDSTSDDGFTPSRLAEDLSNLLTRSNGDLRTALKASDVRVNVGSIDPVTNSVWNDEFDVSIDDPNFRLALVALELNVVVIARRECWEDECDYDPDILHIFDFCDDGTFNRLTTEQRDCLTTQLCSAPPPVQIQVNAVDTDTAAAGSTYDQQIHDSSGVDVGTAANPSAVTDSDIDVNGQDLTSLRAQQPLDIEVLYENGSTASVTIIDSDTIEVPNPAPSPPSDPPSFADALFLFRSDAGQTLVDEELDIWADQSGNGYDASAFAASNRIGLANNKGVFDFKDLRQYNSTNFFATGLPTGSITAFSYDIVIKTPFAFSPQLYAPSVGDINQADIICLLQLGSALRVTVKNSGVVATHVYLTAAIGLIENQCLKLTITYDGSGATNTDRLRLYRDTTYIPPSTAGTIPTSLSNAGGVLGISSFSGSRASYFDIGYFAGWERVLTSGEISANNTWKDQIWD
jgi:hypothetical protein